MRAWPLLARIRSVKIFKVVVFPAPLGPKKPTHFAPSIFKSRFDSAAKEPYRLVRSLASIEGNFSARSCERGASLFQDIPSGILPELDSGHDPSLAVPVTRHPLLFLGIRCERICY